MVKYWFLILVVKIILKKVDRFNPPLQIKFKVKNGNYTTYDKRYCAEGKERKKKR